MTREKAEQMVKAAVRSLGEKFEEIDEIGDYALLVDAQDKSNFSNNRALLVFADGTEKIVDTTENYKYNSARRR